MFSFVYKTIEENENNAYNECNRYEPSDIFGDNLITLSEYEANQYGGCSPTDTAYNIIEGEFQKIYPRGSGNERNECPHDWIKATDDDRFPGMASDKPFGFLKV